MRLKLIGGMAIRRVQESSIVCGFGGRSMYTNGKDIATIPLYPYYWIMQRIDEERKVGLAGGYNKPLL